MPLRFVRIIACTLQVMMLCVSGAVAQDASLVKAPDYTCTSPTGRFRIEQYHTTGGDVWDWEFWVSRKGDSRPVQLPTGNRDPAMYGASFFFHPTEKWLVRTQKTGSGDNVAVLYRISKGAILAGGDIRATFDDLAWMEFDRAYALTGEAAQRYHTWCKFLGWESDGETLRLHLTAAHCGEDYRADWTVHYHVKTRKFFFASDDLAHNKRHGLVWKRTIVRTAPDPRTGIK
jgi:hypothetical protein